MSQRLRGSASRSWSAGWSGVPSVGGPGFADESADDDRGVGQCDECLDDAGASFGAVRELSEAAVVPGVGPFHDPAGTGLEWEVLLTDHPVAAQFSEQFACHRAVVTGVEMGGDLLGQADVEPVLEPSEFLQRGP